MKAKELFIRQIARLTGETHYLFQNVQSIMEHPMIKMITHKR